MSSRTPSDQCRSPMALLCQSLTSPYSSPSLSSPCSNMWSIGVKPPLTTNPRWTAAMSYIIYIMRQKTFSFDTNSYHHWLVPWQKHTLHVPYMELHALYSTPCTQAQTLFKQTSTHKHCPANNHVDHPYNRVDQVTSQLALSIGICISFYIYTSGTVQHLLFKLSVSV